MRLGRFLLSLYIAVSTAVAGEILLPSTTLSRTDVVALTYRMSSQVSGTGEARLRWTDALGRVVEERTIPVTLHDEAAFSFRLDVRKAVAMRNELSVQFSIDGTNLKGPDRRNEEAKATFIARPADARWSDYEIIMWQHYPARLQPALKKLGITGGQYVGRNESPPEMFVANDMRWYAENIATDFYAEYHRYRPDRPTDWTFRQIREVWKKDPNNREAFKRHPSLWDSVWRDRVHDRLVESAKRFSPYRPFFYSLGDESGIADLAAFSDFDFSDISLVRMREWLRGEYATIGALNQEWGTEFADWNVVMPPTTHEAMRKPGDNFAAWGDFKEWMDISFSNALEMGRKAVEEVDPDAFVSIGGGQRPGWGGYDYARIVKALTAIEPYDIGNNVEIIRSLNPKMPMVSTGFARGPQEQQRVWRELFHGHRGLIIWDEKHAYVGEDGQPGERGVEAGKYYNEIRDGIGALIINSTPFTEPIAIHYSQASMRTDWMLARRPEGDAWLQRGARTDRTDDEFLRLRESWIELIEDQGMQFRFVSYGQMEDGELLKGGYKVLILPRSNSLSSEESEAIREFIAQGGTVIADGEPGAFNERSRRLPAPPLADLFGGEHAQPVTTRAFGKGKAVFVEAETLPYLTERLLGKEAATHKLVGDLLRLDVRPEVAVTDGQGNAVVGVETHLYRNGGVTLITLHSSPLQRVDELGPPDFRSNERFEKPVDVTVTLPASAWVYDARGGRSLGENKELRVTVTPYEPVILVASPRPLPKLEVAAPARARRGSVAAFGISARGTQADTHVIHVDVLDPQGNRVLAYSGNLLASQGYAAKAIPLAVNDASGEWTIRFRDVLSGQTETRTLVVE
jgi:hypothetical protein